MPSAIYPQNKTPPKIDGVCQRSEGRALPRFFVWGTVRLPDSRFTVGTVPYANVVGKAVRLFWNSNAVDYAARQVVNGSGD